MTSFVRTATLQRGQPFQIEVNGRLVQAYPGESLAAVLLASGHVTLRRTRQAGAPRSVFCGIGACFDCLIILDGRPDVRSCATLARPGQRVEVPPDEGR
jgi:aerobic-type carbon monoxide dehydrogenase small subunit (CoxS/CutS family)